MADLELKIRKRKSTMSPLTLTQLWQKRDPRLAAARQKLMGISIQRIWPEETL